LSAPAAAANNGVYLPPAPAGPGGEDSIETASGTRCRQSINSNGAYLDVGISGSAAKPVDDIGRAFIADNGRDREALAYARVTIPLGNRPKRIDCSAVFELEIQRLKREIELLRMAAE
jgi:hypothetical protein